MKGEAKVVRTSEQFEAYLLGTLPEGEVEAFEDEVFSDDGAFEALEMAEHHLLERYADRTLDAPTRARVEARLLQDEVGRERLAFTEALAAKGRAARRPWYRQAFTWRLALGVLATAALLLFVVVPPGPQVVTLAPQGLRAASSAAGAPGDEDLVLRLELEEAPPASPRVQFLSAGFARTFPSRVVDGVVQVELLQGDLPVAQYEVRLLDGEDLVATYSLRVE
jgi:hypothetical protein